MKVFQYNYSKYSIRIQLLQKHYLNRHVFEYTLMNVTKPFTGFPLFALHTCHLIKRAGNQLDILKSRNVSVGGIGACMGAIIIVIEWLILV